MVHGQSQLNAVALLTGEVSAGSFLPAWMWGYGCGGEAGAECLWGFHGLPSCSAPEESGPCSPHSTLQLQVASSQCCGGRCALLFLNLSHSVSFLFRLRKSRKEKLCLNEGLVRAGEQPSLLLKWGENTTWLLLQTKQGWKWSVWLLEMVLVLGLTSQPLKSLKKFLPLLS